MLGPDIEAQLGHDPGAVQQMQQIGAVLERDGVLPGPAFTKVTPGISGHGECWVHDSGLFVVRADHRPILLTNERCATCTVAHRDIAHVYLFLSPTDFERGAYMRFLDARIELPSHEGLGQRA